MKLYGEGKKGIFIIGEAPGEVEDQQGIPFVGKSGRILRKALEDVGIDMSRDCWVTNAVICRPPENKTPTMRQISACRGRLLRQVKENEPRLIFVFGKVAWDALLGKDISEVKSFSDVLDITIPVGKFDAFVSVFYHPAYILREDNPSIFGKWKESIERALGYLKVRDFVFPHLDMIVERFCSGITDVEEAITLLEGLNKRELVLSFDIETTGLKPHRRGHRIVSISFSDGKKSWAFPIFRDDVFIVELKKVLENEHIGKVAHNLKFERSWLKNILDIDVVSACWDTCLGAHILDNQRHVGLKYLTFANFGILGYGSDVKRFFESDGSNGKNRVELVPMKDLLLYNALDSLFTYRLYEIQRKRMDSFLSKGLKLFLDGQESLWRASENGVCVDEVRLETLKADLQARLLRFEKNIYEDKDLVSRWKEGRKFNFRSNLDLKKFFFDLKRFNVVNTTAKGNASVDKESMEKIDHPVAKTILEHRKYDKVLNTYAKNIGVELVDGKIHPFYSLHNVDSYRSSSSAPNFQNQPKRDDEISRMIRGCIIPSKGNRLVEYDYSSMEVRISACYNRDPNLIKYIEDSHSDMHRDMASQLFFRSPDEITKEERHIAKNGFVFPAFYGSYYEQMGSRMWDVLPDYTRERLRENGIRRKNSFIRMVRDVEQDFWNNRFRVYSEWKRENWKSYLEKGYIELYTGFRCRGKMTQKQVNNYPIQGSAFHCLLWTLIELDRWMRDQKLESRIIGEIHDAIILDVCPDEERILDESVWRIGTEEIREHWDWIIVPLAIEKQRSDVDGSWGEMKESKVYRT